ncbi:hypothetical protein LguiB_018063 [Lonicera macranthoides]
MGGNRRPSFESRGATRCSVYHHIQPIRVIASTGIYRFLIQQPGLVSLCDLNNQTVTALNLSSMGLAGTFPLVIGNFSFLTSLDISYNNCTIPASLGNLIKLESLNLRFNPITGSVPDVIFNISSLRVIDLSSNDLYGSLPVDVCSRYVPKLERIYLPFNQFEGRIPSNFYKRKELQYLSLAFNEFTGSIPMEIGNLTRLKHLYIGYNNLEVWFHYILAITLAFISL